MVDSRHSPLLLKSIAEKVVPETTLLQQQQAAAHAPQGLVDPRQKSQVVIASGGSRAFYYAGSLARMREEGVKFERYGGSSGGAMMALTGSMGYHTKEEFEPVVFSYDFGRISDLDTKTILQLPASLKEDGLLTGDEIKEWAEYAIARRTGKPEMTFAEHDEWIEAAKCEDISFFQARYAEATSPETFAKHAAYFEGHGVTFEHDFSSPQELMQQAQKMAHLHIATVEVCEDPDIALLREEARLNRPMSLDEQKAILRQHVYIPSQHSAAQTPTHKISEIVAASATIPNFIRRRDIEGREHVDGGLLMPLPYELLTIDGLPDDKTMGLCTKRGEGYQTKPNFAGNAARTILSWKSPSLTATESMFRTQEARATDDPQMQAGTLYMDTGHDSAMNFGMSRQKKLGIWDNSYQQTDQHFKHLDNQKQAIAMAEGRQVNPVGRHL